VASGVAERERRAGLVLDLDDAVGEAMEKLKARGFKSPYLRTFVVARINPLRFIKGEPPPLDELLPSMTKRARGINPDKIRPEDVARTGGPRPRPRGNRRRSISIPSGTQLCWRFSSAATGAVWLLLVHRRFAAREVRMRWRQILSLTCLSGSLALAHVRDAGACGGCFHLPTPPTSPMTTVVTAHRMAFAFSKTRTVLWDQIQYAGSPQDFSWVLPVRGDAKLETAEDAWFESLEAVTNTRVSPPQLNCFTSVRGQDTGCSGGSLSASADFGRPSEGSSTVPPGVTVQHEGTVGPYQYVQLLATSSMSLERWLADNGYVVPDDVQPVVAAYVSEGFGFIALKLRPNVDTREMTPVRVITPGASSTLPLRMVAAGTGVTVGITLYVIAEGRYEIDGFPSVSVDFGKLTWTGTGARSFELSELRRAALASGDAPAG